MPQAQRIIVDDDGNPVAPRARVNDQGDPINQPTPHEVTRAHAQLDDTPGMFGSAGRRELLRTGKEAGIGLLKSPIDAVKGLFGMVAHPIDSATNLASAVTHPLDTIEALGDDPRAAGSMLGQVLMGKLVPGNLGTIGEVAGDASKIAARGVAGLGRGAGAVGRGLETVAASAPAKHLATWGGVEAAMRMDPKGLMVAAAPAALKYGGKGLQAAGRVMERAPSAMDSLMGSGSALEEAAAARQAGFRSGMTPAEPMTPWSPFEAGAESAAEDATAAVTKPHVRLGPGGAHEPLPYGPGESARPGYRSQAGRSIPTTAELDAEYPVGSGAAYDPLMAGRRRMAEERWGLRPESPPPYDILREKMGRVRLGDPPSMQSLESGGSLDELTESLAPAEPVFGRDAFNAKFRQQLMESLARAR